MRPGTDAASRIPGSPVQSFLTELMGIQGQLPPGDPDFDLLRITAGSLFGWPSPGQTVLTQSGSDWAVDSFFDITYRIDFVGHSGSPLGGMSGSTTGTARFTTQVPEASTAAAVAGLALLAGGLGIHQGIRRRIH